MDKTAAELDAHVGRRMRQRREALGLSQKSLGQHLGLTFSQVQKYEKGSNRIGAGRLYLLANFLGVPVQYFFEGIEHTPPKHDKRGELAALDKAFMSISDPETRQSLLDLVCALAPSRMAANGARGKYSPN
jgi:transcriptional regulator with XRE-family HTH domain